MGGLEHRRAPTGALLVGVAPGQWFVMAVAGMLITGVMMPIVDGSLFALLQSTVPPDMQGRVFTLMISGSSLMAPLGLAVAGPLAGGLGVQVWYVAAGVLMVLVGLGGFAVSDIMQVEERGAAYAAAHRQQASNGLPVATAAE